MATLVSRKVATDGLRAALAAPANRRRVPVLPAPGFQVSSGFSEAHNAAAESVWVKALKRHGRFVVLAAPVVTSGRSLRTSLSGQLRGSFCAWHCVAATAFVIAEAWTYGIVR